MQIILIGKNNGDLSCTQRKTPYFSQKYSSGIVNKVCRLYTQRDTTHNKVARTPIKTHKGEGKWPLFVNKQLFWWSASITLDNNNAVLTDS